MTTKRPLLEISQLVCAITVAERRSIPRAAEHLGTRPGRMRRNPATLADGPAPPPLRRSTSGPPPARGKASASEGPHRAVTVAVRGNDTPAGRAASSWKRVIEEKLAFSMRRRPSEATLAMFCAQWPRWPVAKPDTTALAGVHALLLHGEYDTTTPWLAAQRSLELMPQARAILVRDTSEHVLLGHTMLPCMERRAVHYLLTGALPPERITHCDANAAAPL